MTAVANPGLLQHPEGKLFIAVEKPLEVSIEDDQKALEEAGLGSFNGVDVAFVLFPSGPADELGAEKRHHRHGEEIGGEDGKHHSQRQRRKDVFADADKRT